jgi:hypothetical protein
MNEDREIGVGGGGRKELVGESSCPEKDMSGQSLLPWRRLPAFFERERERERERIWGFHDRQKETILTVHVVRVQLDLCALPYHPVHVSGFCG